VEINKSSDITGGVTTEDITEGRHVLLTTHPGWPGELTGRLQDTPGFQMPDTMDEAARAQFLITWPVDNREPPIVYWPWSPFALRQQFDLAGNAPFNRTIYLTYPGLQGDQVTVIPSGHLAIAFSCCGGVFTVPSGQYVYDVTMQVPGTRLRVCDFGTDGAAVMGMLAIMVSGSTAIAQVERFNATTMALTFRHLC